MLLSPLLGYAQQEDDNNFGGWHFVEIGHKFGDSKVTGMLYFEHKNYQYKRLDCWYLRPDIRYNVSPELDTQDDELCSRLLVAYNIPNLSLMPYIAAELFTWDKTWRKSRHDVACTYNLTQYVQLEAMRL